MTREDYLFVNWCYSYARDNGKTKHDTDAALADFKRAHRARYRDLNEYEKRCKKVFTDKNGNSVQLIDFSDLQRGAAEELFKDIYYIPRPCSFYDCTGQLFTYYYKFVEIGGALHALNYITMDI